MTVHKIITGRYNYNPLLFQFFKTLHYQTAELSRGKIISNNPQQTENYMIWTKSRGQEKRQRKYHGGSKG